MMNGERLTPEVERERGKVTTLKKFAGSVVNFDSFLEARKRAVESAARLAVALCEGGFSAE
jgi:hypothetical protein